MPDGVSLPTYVVVSNTAYVYKTTNKLGVVLGRLSKGNKITGDTVQNNSNFIKITSVTIGNVTYKDKTKYNLIDGYIEVKSNNTLQLSPAAVQSNLTTRTTQSIAIQDPVSTIATSKTVNKSVSDPIVQKIVTATSTTITTNKNIGVSIANTSDSAKSDEHYYININNAKVYKDTKLSIVSITIPFNFIVKGGYLSGNTGVFWITSPSKYKGYISSKYISKKKNPVENIPGTNQPKSTSTSTKKDVSSSSSTVNTSSDGATSIYEQTIQEAIYNDDSFTIVYGDSDLTDSQYRNNIDGLQVKDIRGILGCPHQFLPIADARIDSTNTAGSEPSIGRVYADKIIKQMPLLLITPGVPELLTSFSKDQKASILKRLFGDNNRSDIENLFSKCSGKYYSLKYAYTEYFYYVNAMLRAAAYFLQIENTVIDGRKLSNYNWLYYTTNSNNTDGDIFGHEGLRKFLGPYAGCIAMYADCGNNVDDTFSNSTSQSSLSSMVDGASDQAREINFLIGNIGGLVGIQTNRLTSMESLDTNISEFTSLVDRIVGHKNGFISRVAGQVQTILAGGRMIFPEIWSDSSFSRSYNCKMKLVSPSGDKLSIYLNILVPIYHLLGLVLPRQGSGQTYYSPFLVRGYCKGLFNVDLGILGDLNVTKGEEGEWTKDGLPTVAEVSFTIKDLYDGMFMSKYENPLSPTGIMSNITELDYIANSCGINVNDQEIIRTIKMYVGLGFGDVRDRIDIGIFGNIAQYFNQKLNNIFGVFK